MDFLDLLGLKVQKIQNAVTKNFQFQAELELLRIPLPSASLFNLIQKKTYGKILSKKQKVAGPAQYIFGRQNPHSTGQIVSVPSLLMPHSILQIQGNWS